MRVFPSVRLLSVSFMPTERFTSASFQAVLSILETPRPNRGESFLGNLSFFDVLCLLFTCDLAVSFGCLEAPVLPSLIWEVSAAMELSMETSRAVSRKLTSHCCRWLPRGPGPVSPLCRRSFASTGSAQPLSGSSRSCCYSVPRRTCTSSN